MTVEIYCPETIIGADLLDRFHEVQLWPGEDEALYEDMREEMKYDLSPQGAYEKSLVEKMIQLEWDTRRIRRMRDTVLMGAFKLQAASAYMMFATKMEDVLGMNPEASQFARDLVHPDPKRHGPARKTLAKMELTEQELATQAYLAIPEQLEPLESRIAEAEVRQRRLMNDLFNLRAQYAKLVIADVEDDGDLKW